MEWLHTKVKQGLYYQHLNLGTVTAYAPDGRTVRLTALCVLEALRARIELIEDRA